MTIQELAGRGQGSVLPAAATLAAAGALLNQPTQSGNLGAQLEAYSALAGRWPQATDAERPALAEALGDSRFSQRIQTTLNLFTRAAWAGPDAVPPAPQLQALRAFDGLPAPDRQIVAALRGGTLGAFPLTSVAAYRARLQAEAEAAATDAAPTARRPDLVSLSEAAQAHLAGQAAGLTSPTPPGPQPRSQQLTAALAAYAKTAG
jgi:hypothetical protein